MKYSQADIIKLLNGIFEGTITPYELPEDLYFAIADYLKKAVYLGFGATLDTVDETDLDLLTQLRENVYMFSAAKTYQETRAMTDLLTDGERLRTFAEFREQALKVYEQYNEDWLKTEYNTAVGQADAAVKWNEIEKNKDVLPNLRYSAIIDDVTSDICAPLDGLVAPVDDPIWNSVAPLNHFNCRCVLLQEEGADGPALTPDDDKTTIIDGVKEKMQDVFKSNPGKKGEVFTKQHPYFREIVVEDKPYAKTNFGLPIPKTD